MSVTRREDNLFPFYCYVSKLLDALIDICHELNMLLSRRNRSRNSRLSMTVFIALFLATIYVLLSLQLVKIDDLTETKRQPVIEINFYTEPEEKTISVLPRQQEMTSQDLSQTKPLRRQSNISKAKMDITFMKWLNTKRSACNGNMVVFNAVHFVTFQDLLFNKHLVSSRNRGGEEMSDVMNQNEEDEYFKIKPGFFSIACLDYPSGSHFSPHHGHLNKWLEKTLSVPNDRRTSTFDVNRYTVIIKRYEYVNLYHTMTDYYSAFLMMTFCQKTPKQTNILFFDTHPSGALDSVWNTLFGTTMRVSTLKNITRFKEAVWAIPGYDTPMYDYHSIPSIPLIDDFHNFFLKQYGITAKSKLDCHKLHLVAIWRRNYVAHPRNPRGKIERKIANEDELLREANKTGVFSSVIGVQLDKLPMKSQLSLISNADILVGMHGAGLTHTLFLPKYGGLIELLPDYFASLGHFEGLARWRRLHYIRWKNSDYRNELDDKRTRIPPSIFKRLLLEMRSLLCAHQ